jgi:tRNA/rRNA methyltransferase
VSATGHDAARAAGALARVRVVLVRPRGAANVGAVARAMKNMGLADLVLVRPALRGRVWADAMAVHAGDVLARARTLATLGEAVEDCALVVGTTCRGGLYRDASETPEALAPAVLAQARRRPVALVFGPEDHGLSNADLAHCQRLVAIPASPEYASLNLAQAVMICCYALRRAALGAAAGATDRVLAPAGTIRFALARLQAALLRIGFLHGENPEHIMFALRRIFGRAGLEPRDVRILLGIARQIEWYARAGWRQVRAAAQPDAARADGAPRVVRRRA